MSNDPAQPNLPRAVPAGVRYARLLLPALLLLFSALCFGAETNRPPHIVLVLADDMGLGDTSACGGAGFAETPGLERLAREGTRFDRYYSASPICSPSRCGIITGQWPARWLLTSYLQKREGNRLCGQADFLNPAAPSLPGILRRAGYATAHVGKWHLGGGRDVADAPPFSAYGYDLGLGTYESPEPAAALGLKTLPWGPDSGREPQQVPRSRRTAWMVDQALDFLRRHPDRPCFVNLWLDDVHSPWTPADPARGAGAEKANLRGVIREMDAQVARLMDSLPANTLLIFASDNGAGDRFVEERGNGLRGGKLSLYEGGIRVPFLVRWPGVVPAGRVDSSSVLHAVDLLPTLAAIAGAPLPEGFRGDGFDASGALRGKPFPRPAPLFWEYGRNETSFKYPKPPGRSPNVAMMEGDWKLLVNADGSGGELYDLAADPRETANLLEKRPEVAARLRQACLAWRASLPRLPQGP